MKIGEMACQEYLCKAMATTLIWSHRDSRVYPMCEACADHSVKNRGMEPVTIEVVVER
jgi:hypothetical protein